MDNDRMYYYIEYHNVDNIPHNTLCRCLHRYPTFHENLVNKCIYTRILFKTVICTFITGCAPPRAGLFRSVMSELPCVPLWLG